MLQDRIIRTPKKVCRLRFVEVVIHSSGGAGLLVHLAEHAFIGFIDTAGMVLVLIRALVVHFHVVLAAVACVLL